MGYLPFRVRSGIPTGTTKHFDLWMTELRVKSTLQKMRLDDLADAPQPGEVSSTLAIIRVNSSMRSVWDLSQTDLSALLSIPQVNPARLEELESYLKDRKVSLNWTVS